MRIMALDIGEKRIILFQKTYQNDFFVVEQILGIPHAVRKSRSITLYLRQQFSLSLFQSLRSLGPEVLIRLGQGHILVQIETAGKYRNRKQENKKERTFHNRANINLYKKKERPGVMPRRSLQVCKQAYSIVMSVMVRLPTLIGLLTSTPFLAFLDGSFAQPSLSFSELLSSVWTVALPLKPGMSSLSS